MNELASADLLAAITQDANQGQSFVPLIGSGLSSPSGIIMGQEFSNYLAFTTYLVLASPDHRSATHGEGKARRWDLRTRGWPPLPSEKEMQNARAWVKEHFQELCNRLNLVINYDDSRDEPKIRSVSPALGESQQEDIVSSLTTPITPAILKSPDAVPVSYRSRRFFHAAMEFAGDSDRLSAVSLDKLFPSSSRSYESRALETGLRSLHDWRETLEFLSLIDVSTNEIIVMSERDTSVIDAFNVFITRDKKPSLGHKLVAHLSGPLRIRTVLTTNFDTLIESAYRGLQIPLRVLAVSTRGQLPPARTVAADDCILKLHGEMQDTRADLSLDYEPSDLDKKTFTDYMTHGAGHLNAPALHRESKRLLVIGYSGWDHRCVQLIKHWLEYGRGDRKVYWLGFSDADQRRVSHLFSDAKFDSMVHFATTSRPDLFLNELYQRIVGALPPGGIAYEFTHVEPPQRLIKIDSTKEKLASLNANVTFDNEAVSNILTAIDNESDATTQRRAVRDLVAMQLSELMLKAVRGQLKYHSPSGNYTGVHIGVGSADLWGVNTGNDEIQQSNLYAFGASNQFHPVVIRAIGGVVRACNMAMRKLRRNDNYKVFWFETQDYSDADELLRDLLRAIAIRYGVFQSHHVTLHPLQESISHYLERSPAGLPREERLSKEISRHLASVLSEYRADPPKIACIFYGRDSYGACSGILPEKWSSKDFLGLHAIVRALGFSGIKALYFPLVNSRASFKSTLIEECRVSVENGMAGYESELQTHKEQMRRWDRDAAKKSGAYRPAEQLWTAETGLIAKERDSLFSSPVEAGRLSVLQDMVERLLHDYYDVIPSSSKHDLKGLSLRPKASVSGIEYLVFLYSLTLFRHSRHLNALSSEGVFACPFRFNTLSIDNDAGRSTVVDAWTNRLRSARVFFEKPGGAFWMHRDIRLALRSILEQTPIGAFTGRLTGESDLPSGEGEDGIRKRTYFHFAELKSRLHYWIGDWYFNAYCSSGDVTPVMESLHHRVLAAANAPYAVPRRNVDSPDKTFLASELLQHRALLYEAALLEGSKTLLLSWRSIQQWQACYLEPSWLSEEHRKRVESVLRRAREEVLSVSDANHGTIKGTVKDAWAVRLEAAQFDIIRVMKSCANMLTLEGGGRASMVSVSPETSSVYLGGIKSWQASPIKEVPFEVTHEWSVIHQSEDEFWITMATHFSEKCLTPPGKSGKEAGKLLLRIKALAQSSEGKRPHKMALLSQAKAAYKQECDGHTGSIHSMIWLLGELAFILMRRAKLRLHAENAICASVWLACSIACSLGLDLCKHLPSQLLEYQMLEKVRLGTLYGLALANMGRFAESARRLNEAEAIASRCSKSTPADRAAIILRRAESKLTEAFWLGEFIKEEKKQKGTATYPEILVGRKGVRVVTHKELFVGHGASWGRVSISRQAKLDDGKVACIPRQIEECFNREGGGHHSALRRYAALIDEATVMLDRAEVVLGGSSQSSLWWSRLYALRLRIYGMLDLFEKYGGSADGEAILDCQSLLAFRKLPADKVIHESFINYMRIGEYDLFRKFRGLKYFFEANAWHANHVSNEPKVITYMLTTYAHSLEQLKSFTSDLALSDTTQLSDSDIAFMKRAASSLAVGKASKKAIKNRITKRFDDRPLILAYAHLVTDHNLGAEMS